MSTTACPKCHEPAQQGQLVCLKCGTLLFNPSNSTMNMRIDPSLLRLRRSQKQLATQLGPERIVTLHIRGLVERLIFEEGTEIVLGRLDLTNPVDTRLDLTRYGGRERGVSREHAVLRFSDNQLTITDLNSINGTLVNLQKLPPNEPRLLNDGDQVMLGTLSVVVHFEAAPEQPQSEDGDARPTNPQILRLLRSPLPPTRLSNPTRKLPPLEGEDNLADDDATNPKKFK